jgi:hypothetical protein
MNGALQAANARRLELRSFPTDHNYADQRVALAGVVVEFLQRAASAAR